MSEDPFDFKEFAYEFTRGLIVMSIISMVMHFLVPNVRPLDKLIVLMISGSVFHYFYDRYYK